MVTASDFYIVVGLGKSGLSLVRYLASQGVPFAVVDTRSNPPELDRFKEEYPAIEVRCGELDVEFLCRAKVLFVSPGVDLKTDALQRAVEQGVVLSGDIDLFSQIAKAPIIAITGSNGKSTVTTLVGEMAKAAGKKVAVGGNLGKPALELLDDAVELYVLELSSFQLESCKKLGAEVATVLNISEDHMDRYVDIADYASAKYRIFLGAKQVVINLDDPLSTADNIDKLIPHWTFTTQAISNDDKGFALQVVDGIEHIVFNGQALIALDKLKIKGRHNYANAMASLALGHAVGLPFAVMLEALVQFKGLDHRCEWVAEKAGVAYYNDSKATNIGAALAAIEGIGRDIKGKLVLILGGDGKGADFSTLTQPIEQYCRAVVLLGRDATIIEQSLLDSTKRVHVNSIEQAAKMSSELAEAGDAVLLAPACASLDMFKDFGERGYLFMQAVKELV